MTYTKAACFDACCCCLVSFSFLFLELQNASASVILLYTVAYVICFLRFAWQYKDSNSGLMASYILVTLAQSQSHFFSIQTFFSRAIFSTIRMTAFIFCSVLLPPFRCFTLYFPTDKVGEHPGAHCPAASFEPVR